MIGLVGMPSKAAEKIVHMTYRTAKGLTCTHLPSYQVSQKSQAIQNSPVLHPANT